MKYLTSAALALALLGGTSALAQPDPNEHRERGGQGGEHAPRGGEAAAPRPAPAAQPAPAARPAPAGPRDQSGPRSGPTPVAPPNEQGYRGAPRGRENAPATPSQPNVQDYRGAPRGGPRDQGGQRNSYQPAPGAQRAPGADQAGRAASHNVPNTYRPRFGAPGARPGADRPRYNPQYFPRVFRPDRRYAWRGGDWRGQPGYYYRHWGYGDRLPFGWFGEQWFIDDYYYYDLPVPPYGYEWVRVGPDALLVDLDNGEVVESVYGIFY